MDIKQGVVVDEERAAGRCDIVTYHQSRGRDCRTVLRSWYLERHLSAKPNLGVAHAISFGVFIARPTRSLSSCQPKHDHAFLSTTIKTIRTTAAVTRLCFPTYILPNRVHKPPHLHGNLQDTNKPRIYAHITAYARNPIVSTS